MVHENLRNARKAKNLTQQQVADLSGISLRHYQQFESGNRILTNASFYIVMNIAAALGVHVDELVKGGPSSFQWK